MNKYFEHSSISQSQLKRLLISPRAWEDEETKEMYYEEKEHFIVGSAVDFILTEPDKNFEDYYHVSELENKPSATIMSIIKQVFDMVVSITPLEEVGHITDSQYRDIILTACVEHDYQTRWKSETKISKICEGYEYWADLKEAENKIILSAEQKALIDEVSMSLRTDEDIAEYFNAEEVKFQVPIFFDYNGLDCKSLLDMIIINREKKTIQPIDIKTMGDYTLNFAKALRKRRYDIQAAFYTAALKWLYPDYEILPFKFIVESTIAPGEPLVFTCTESLLHMGKQGRPTLGVETFTPQGEVVVAVQRDKILGFEQLIDLYKYYSEHGFEKDKLVRENKSELTLNWEGIVEEL